MRGVMGAMKYTGPCVDNMAKKGIGVQSAGEIRASIVRVATLSPTSYCYRVTQIQAIAKPLTSLLSDSIVHPLPVSQTQSPAEQTTAPQVL